MLKKTSLAQEEIQKIRNLAREVVENPTLIDWIVTLLWDNVKYDKKEFPKSSIESINRISKEGEKDIPSSILKFLQENVISHGNKMTGNKQVRLERIFFFIETIRKYLLMKVDNNIYISSKIIYSYSQIFNIKSIKNLKPTTINQLRLAFAVALVENDNGGILGDHSECIDNFYELYCLTTAQQREDLFNVVKQFNSN